MKKILFISMLFVSLSVNMTAQLLPGGDQVVFDESEKNIHSLTNTSSFDLSVKTVNTSDDLAWEVGLKYGSMLNSYLNLAFGFNYLLSQNIEVGDRGEYLTMTYGGLTPQLILPTMWERMYLTFDPFIGLGYCDYSTSTDFEVSKPELGDWLLVFELSAGLLVRATPDIAVGFNLGYRQTTSFEIIDFSEKDLNEPFMQLNFRFVVFKD